LGNLWAGSIQPEGNTGNKIIVVFNGKAGVRVNTIYYLLISTSSGKLNEEIENKSKPNIK
jgi:hypothetical protein